MTASARRAIVPLLLGALTLTGEARQQPAPPPVPQAPPARSDQGRATTQAQQRPVFRGGTHFVRVDAYPAQDGKIVEGLQAGDFEILEDGKPQAIESFDFVKFDTFTPEAERRDPATQREGFDLAADPRYRVFVIFVDMAFSSEAGPFASINDLDRIQGPLGGLLDRVLGPQDLFGFLTSRNSVKDLVLAQKTAVTRAQIADVWRASLKDKDAADALDGCSCGEALRRSLEECRALIEGLKRRHRADATYSALSDLVLQLGAIRQERKNVLFVTNQLPRWRPDDRPLKQRGAVLPGIGAVNGRPGIGDQQVGANDTFCLSEFQRLADMDFDDRYRRLLAEARQQNVSFDVITPAGLQAPVGLAATREAQGATRDLQSLASETDGIAVVNTNDLNAGIKRIADDLAAYYVLGYYTTNTNFDGGVRTIKVRYKANGSAIRARRQYRAPTQAEIAALSAPQPSAAVSSGASSAKPVLVGEPIAYRVALRQPPQRLSLPELDRTERLRVEWPVLATLDRREARLLDQLGRPLPVDIPVAEAPGEARLVVELPLAALGRGGYAIELTAGSGTMTETRRLAFRVK